MAMGTPQPTDKDRDAPAARVGWRQWLQVAAAALALLALSEALWLWQTWPVRELLATPVALAPLASGP
jgi:hypothetical protein